MKRGRGGEGDARTAVARQRLRDLYPPDAAADDTLDRLIARLNDEPGCTPPQGEER